MDHHRDLEIILEAIGNLRDTVHREARILDSNEVADLTRLGLEAKQILNAELGSLNDFSMSIQHELTGFGGELFNKPGSGKVAKLHAIISGGSNQINRKISTPTRAVRMSPQDMYVSPSRIAELRAVPKKRWDLLRLVRLTEELNVVSKEHCQMATAMLVRAIADHVPPIFGCTNFDHVANNAQLPKSVKASFLRLQGSLRNIADAHLHLHVREREVLPTPQQVDFRQDLDVLLAEVVRVLK